MMSHTRWAALAIVVVLLAALPMGISSYAVSFLISIFLAVALAGSWNLFAGTTGYVSLGHGLFFGIGAYAFSVSMATLGYGPVLSFAIAAASAAVSALLLGFVLLTTRIRVAYFAIVMLGFNEIIKTVVANTKSLGSSYGLTLPQLPNTLIAYYFLLSLALLVMLLFFAIQRSKWGYGLKAILADEVAAEVTGVNTVALKMAMFAISGTLVGLAGAMIAWHWSYIDPYMAFDLGVSFEMVVMAVFGGVGSLWGPLLGAVAMSLLKEFLNTTIPQLHSVIFGALVLVLILWCPGGIIELTGGLRRRFKKANLVAETMP
jgi:branched-chain amino acid transport system permease protein